MYWRASWSRRSLVSTVVTLAAALSACGPGLSVGSDSADAGGSTTDAPLESTGETLSGTSGDQPTVDSDSDEGPSDGGGASSSTGASPNQSCIDFAQMAWDESGELFGHACGDMTLAGLAPGQIGLLVVSVPPILGSPWDEDWQAHALYTLPDRAVVGHVARYPEPVPLDAEYCQPGGGLLEGAVEVYDIEADLDFYLLNRDEVGCLFTCDNIYARLSNPSIDCGGETIPLGEPGDENPTIVLHGHAELP